MSIRGSNFENQHPFASDHALVWERCIPDGLLYGVDMSFTSTLFTLGTGFMLVAGRMFEIAAAESVSISPGSGYARVYVAIDTGGTATENSFDQVSFGVDYAANLDSFTELTQGEININQGAAVYQAEVAVLAINSSGVTAIERQMELVSPGAGTGAFAAIAVRYPAGSTVTVTDGKITYTAPNTNGAALFIIPYAATWTVTATDGTETATQTVEITTEGQSVNVKLAYALVVFSNGAFASGYTAANVRKATNSIVNGNLYCRLSENDYGAVFIDPAIDVTSFNRAEILVASSAHQYLMALGIAKNKTAPTTTTENIFDSYATIPEGEKTAETTYPIELANYTGAYYLGISLVGANSYQSQGYAAARIKSITFYS